MSLPKLISIELMMPSNQLIFCHPLLLMPLIFPSIRVFSNESALFIRWPKYIPFQLHLSPELLVKMELLYSGASQVVLVVKNLPANAGDTRDTGLVPGSGRSPEGESVNPLEYSSLKKKSHGQRSLESYNLWDRKESAALRHVGSSQTSDLTCVSCTDKQILNHWTTKEVPLLMAILTKIGSTEVGKHFWRKIITIFLVLLSLKYH